MRTGSPILGYQQGWGPFSWEFRCFLPFLVRRYRYSLRCLDGARDNQIIRYFNLIYLERNPSDMTRSLCPVRIPAIALAYLPAILARIFALLDRLLAGALRPCTSPTGTWFPRWASIRWWRHPRPGDFCNDALLSQRCTDVKRRCVGWCYSVNIHRMWGVRGMR